MRGASKSGSSVRAARAGRTIWLTGMMGAGKSSVGPLLAGRLGVDFVDLDLEIEREAGRRIAEIFEAEGETGFRARERAAVAAIAGRRAVVALGGGAIAQPGVRERLAASGTIVHLRARPETLLARVGDADARPLLRGLGARERLARIEALLAERAPHYAAAAIAVDVDEESAAAVAARVHRALAAKGRKEPGMGGRVDTGMRRVVPVALGERSYDVEIGSGTLAEAGPAIARRTKASRAVVVTVPSVARRHAPLLLRSLRDAGIVAKRVLVPEGDAHKSFREATRLYDALLDAEIDRGGVVIALGGGMVGDLAGFVAATWLRGVSFVQVPTTVLAMVDASIGGKVAVNLPRGKNLVGAFHQPRLVWIDLDVLRSLPMRERAAGFAEIVKAGAILDEGFFGFLEQRIEDALALEPSALLPAIERACAIKAEVVAKDERESGLRMLLNFGHTLAHAIETLTRYRGVLHGEAVSIGMVYAARRSEALGLAPAGTADRLEALLGRAGLPIEAPRFPRGAYLRALRVDKKRTEARIRYVVLRGIGRAETLPLTPEEILPAGFGGGRAPARRRAGTRGRR